jgi:hypothetical protein
MIGRKLLSAAVPLTPDQAADESVDLKQLERTFASRSKPQSPHSP